MRRSGQELQTFPLASPLSEECSITQGLACAACLGIGVRPNPQSQMTSCLSIMNTSQFIQLFRSWLRAKYSHSPSDDQEGVRKLLGLYEEQQQQQRQRNGEQSWMNQAASVYPLPYNAYRRSGHRNPHFCAGSLVLVQPSLYCGVDHSLEGLVPYPTVQHSAAQGSKCD
nr:PREDICTED: uncharacterized protein LOC102686038 isoform X7 [Lepisosteus oculatus]